MSRKRDDFEECHNQKDTGFVPPVKKIKSPLSTLGQATLTDKMVTKMAVDKKALVDTKDADLDNRMKLATTSSLSAEVWWIISAN